MNEFETDEFGDRLRTTSELETLIKMAEDISDTLELLHNTMSAIRAKVLFSMVGFYGAISGLVYSVLKLKVNVDNTQSIGIVTFLAALSIAFAYSSYLNMRYLKATSWKCKSEGDILKHLLNMVFEYRDHLYIGGSGYVEAAIIDMRLKRIMFSTERYK